MAGCTGSSWCVAATSGVAGLGGMDALDFSGGRESVGSMGRSSGVGSGFVGSGAGAGGIVGGSCGLAIVVLETAVAALDTASFSFSLSFSWGSCIVGSALSVPKVFGVDTVGT